VQQLEVSATSRLYAGDKGPRGGRNLLVGWCQADEFEMCDMSDAELQATRRTVLGGTSILGMAMLASFARPTAAQTSGKTFVLVHGAWGAGWLWRRVANRLIAKGHMVFTPTMTGVGERSHLLDAKIRLATHVTDIVNVIKWERLTDIVLVGHSYGGMVITGVAEQVRANDFHPSCISMHLCRRTARASQT
jgi:pimeloyl-ACP methyl ester carboxylesterase